MRLSATAGNVSRYVPRVPITMASSSSSLAVRRPITSAGVDTLLSRWVEFRSSTPCDIAASSSESRKVPTGPLSWSLARIDLTKSRNDSSGIESTVITHSRTAHVPHPVHRISTHRAPKLAATSFEAFHLTETPTRGSARSFADSSDTPVTSRRDVGSLRLPATRCTSYLPQCP